MNGAFGIPRGFFSALNIDVDAIVLSSVDWDLPEIVARHVPIGVLTVVFFYSTSMSRLIVKNLPSNLTHERLRKHFEQQGAPPGTITDIKIARKPDGTSRRFAFVGYKTDKEAAAARDWFDRTFINSARLSVTVIEVRTMHSFWRRSYSLNRAPRTHQRLVQINGADSPTWTTVAASRQNPLHWMSLQRKPFNGLRVSSFVIWPFHVLTTISSPSFDHLEKLCR